MSTMILDLLTRGVVLTADGGRLRYDGPDGAMTVEDLEGLRANKEANLEMLRSPYTGSKVLTLALTLDKPMTKRILFYHGLPTPEFQVFEEPDEPLDRDLIGDDGELRFPLFVKPSREGTSMGVSAESIVTSVGQLRAQVEKQLGLYNQPILCEHYIEGREVTVGIIGNLEPTAARRVKERTLIEEVPDGLMTLPALEVNLGAYDESEAGLYTNRMKTELADNFQFLCPAPLEPNLLHQLNLLAATVFLVTDCKDVARVDFRLDRHNGSKPYILEVNPLPGLNPTLSDLCFQSSALGWSYEQLINTIVSTAAERQGLITRVR